VREAGQGRWLGLAIGIRLRQGEPCILSFFDAVLSANEPFSPRFTLCYLTGVAPQSQAGKERGYARFPGRWIIES